MAPMTRGGELWQSVACAPVLRLHLGVRLGEELRDEGEAHHWVPGKKRVLDVAVSTFRCVSTILTEVFQKTPKSEISFADCEV